jgi:hypothetical protein
MDMRDTEALGNLEEFLRPLLGRMLFTWNSEIQKTVFTKFFQNANARQLVNPSNNLGGMNLKSISVMGEMGNEGQFIERLE